MAFRTALGHRHPAGGDLLICINSRTAKWGEGVMMTPATLSPIRHCPVCRIAMQASKSREDLAKFDTFQCLACGTVIRESSPPGTAEARVVRADS
jgi:hypothetical protein